MSLLQSTLFGAVFILPGAFSLAIALSPKGRAIRPSSLTTRAVGLITFALLDWFLALLLYAWLCSGGHHGENLAILLLENGDPAAAHRRSEVVANLLSFPPAVRWFSLLLSASVVLTGAPIAALQNAVITGTAIRDFNLECLSTSRPGRLWFGVSRFCECLLTKARLASLFQPMGAGYWLVIQKAADLRKKDGDRKVILVYADVLQGEEVVERKVGVLYTGAVRHLVCETDGNIVFVLLVEAKRWSEIDGKLTWKPIRESEAFALEGASIRNISFRLFEQLPVPKPEGWVDGDASPKRTKPVVARLN